MRRQKELPDEYTPHKLMRIQNCKTYAFRKNEIYPSVRPPVSNCSPYLTFKWLCNAVENAKCEPCEPYMLNRMQGNLHAAKSTNVKEESTKRAVNNPCKERQHISDERKLPKSILDYSELAPKDVMRMLNCKTGVFQLCEAYPSIKPRVSRCSPELTAKWLADALEDNGCDHLFHMENDDLVEFWRGIPNKDVLGCYGVGGVGSAIAKAEALFFDQAIAKCLEKVKPQTDKPQKSIDTPAISKKSKKQKKKLILNRPLLKSKINRIPGVEEALKASNAFKWVHCHRSPETNASFFQSKPQYSLQEALDMERPVRKKRNKKCKPDNLSMDDILPKQDQHPCPYQMAYQREMKRLALETQTEPKNYDDLYSQLVTVFEKKCSKDLLSEGYTKCCRQPPKRGGKDRDVEVPRIRIPGKKAGNILFGVRDDADAYAGGAKDGGIKGTGDTVVTGAGTGFGVTGNTGVTGVDAGFAVTGDTGVTDAGARFEVIGDTGVTGAGAGAGDTGFTDTQGADKTNVDAEKANQSGDPLKITNVPVRIAPLFKDKKQVKAKPEKPSAHHRKSQASWMKKYKLSFLDEDLEIEKNKLPRKSIYSLMSLIEDKKPKVKRPKCRKKCKSYLVSKAKKPVQTKPKDCPCEICYFMGRREREPDSPLICQMKKENKRRELLDYYRRNCHREQMENRQPEYPAVQNKCDPIICDDRPYYNLEWEKNVNRLSALQDLQKVVGTKHYDKVKALKDRLCWRICESF